MRRRIDEEKQPKDGLTPPSDDKISPVHQDENGDPRIYTLANSERDGHSPNDSRGKETSHHITPELCEPHQQVLLGLFNEVFAEPCPCRKEILK